MTLPQIDTEKGTKLKGFRLPLRLIRRMEKLAEKDHRTLTGFLIHHLEETLPKEK